MNLLKITWSISRGQNTYGYNICRLDDLNTGKRFKTMGGGYDMIGTVVGDWIEDTFQEKLLNACLDDEFKKMDGLFYHSEKNKVRLDGGYGINSMIKIAKAIGVTLTPNFNRRTRKNEGYFYSID